MSSFISLLSCLILVLASSIFTLPIDHKFSTTTFSSLNNDGTTGQPFNLRLVSDDEIIESSTIISKPSSNKHMKNSRSSVSSKNAFQEPYMFVQSMNSKEFTPTTTLKPMTETEEAAQRGVTDEVENKNDMKVESTTNDMLSFSSTVDPQSDLLESSTKKNVGLLNDQEEEKEVKKPSQSRKFPSRKPKGETGDKLDETTYPTAVIADQSVIKNFSKVPIGYLTLDESTGPAVTDRSKILSSTTPKKDEEEKKPLQQGEE